MKVKIKTAYGDSCKGCGKILTKETARVTSNGKLPKVLYIRKNCEECIADKLRTVRGHKKRVPVTNCVDCDCILTDKNVSIHKYTSKKGKKIEQKRNRCKKCMSIYNWESVKKTRAKKKKVKVENKPKVIEKPKNIKVKKEKIVKKEVAKTIPLKVKEEVKVIVCKKSVAKTEVDRIFKEKEVLKSRRKVLSREDQLIKEYMNRGK